MFLRLDLGLLSPKVQGKMAAHLPNETNIETDDVAPKRFFFDIVIYTGTDRTV